MKILAIAFIPAGLFLAPTPAFAKSDEQVWGTASLLVKLDDRWRLSQEFTTRFSDNRNGLYEIESNSLLGYRFNKTVTLNLSSEALNGTWKLRVNDNATQDTGYIDSWSVTF